MTVKKESPTRRQSSLETANEMFKSAFNMKKMKFHQENPSLSDAELNQKTAQYFRKIAESEK